MNDYERRMRLKCDALECIGFLRGVIVGLPNECVPADLFDSIDERLTSLHTCIDELAGDPAPPAEE